MMPGDTPPRLPAPLLARYAVGGACLLVTASLAMAVPYLLKRGIDAIQRGEPFSVAAELAAAIVAIALVQAVTARSRGR